MLLMERRFYFCVAGSTVFYWHILFHLTIFCAFVGNAGRVDRADSGRGALPSSDILQAPHIGPPNGSGPSSYKLQSY